ncbi:T9SS type A sorting domain-containing protein [Zobellia alginiliquefaciens]|uniref:T9SS type A sorting domain-containing protein n=1 Tax=Zobellia alginiliquefaciens TaxID=3032586 RepID=UPI0023E3E64F|nr:T9SS type A sorting domain-containing protein [Zobellia alginiliquefaciens]
MERKLLFNLNANNRSLLYWSALLLTLVMFFMSPTILANDTTEASEGGEISGGPFMFCVGDNYPDHVSGVEVSGNNGENSQWVVTDEAGTILGLPPNPEAVDFDGAGPGTCLIWHLSYTDGLAGLAGGMNISGLEGEFNFSNSVTVYRNQPDGGTLTGGPFEFYVDGSPDMVSGIAVTGKRSGKNSTFVITDEAGKILGIPPSMAAVEGVDFDGAGAGTCLIWHLRYEDGLQGAEMGLNANDLVGCYDLSNPIEVVRKEKMVVNAGELSGGPFYFCVDGIEDMVSGITMDGDAVGTNSSFVITDDTGKILGLPPTMEALEGVNFDGAGAGTCLIWYLKYEDGLEGAEMGLNAHNLKGNFDLSNSIMVVRTETDAGTLTGGPFEFYVDGTPDMVSGIAVTGKRSGKNSTFVITDEAGKILGIPPSMGAVEGVDFDGAGAGTCLIWHLRYEDGLQGAEMGLNANDLVGCYDLSNPIEVVRKEKMVVNAGELSGGPFYFCVDGIEDMVSGITMDGDAVGTNSSFVITDDTGKILGLPPTIEALEGVNFDGAGAGTCLIWYLKYEDGLEGAEMGMNAHDLKGNFDLSNSIMVVRTETDAGTLTGGPFEFYVDGTPDMVSGIAVTGKRSGKNSTFVITDEAGKILGIPPSMAAVEGVDFDGAGAGTCLIWHLRYEDGLQGAEMGLNTNDLVGCYDLSNPIEVVRKEIPVTETTSKAYPIPASDVLTVSLPEFTAPNVAVSLFDVAGNPVKTEMSSVEDKQIALNVQSVPGGLYLLRISQPNGKTITKKIVIK